MLLTRLGLAIIWLARLLPYPLLKAAGRGLGMLSYALARRRRHIVHTNLHLCFPQWTTEQRTRIARAHFQAAGISLLERGILWWSSRERIKKLVRIEGLEHLLAHRGRPVVLLAPHFVGIDMGGLRLTLEVHLASVYGPQRNLTIDRLVREGRERFGTVNLVSRKEGVRPLLKHLKDGTPLYYLPDQDYGIRNAVFATFFGVPAATLTTLPRLAQVSGALIVPCVTRQTGDGYAVRLYPAWEGYPGGDLAMDTQRMNDFIESVVREMPEQYYWLHRRFKTRPPGAAKLY